MGIIIVYKFLNAGLSICIVEQPTRVFRRQKWQTSRSTMNMIFGLGAHKPLFLPSALRKNSLRLVTYVLNFLAVNILIDNSRSSIRNKLIALSCLPNSKIRKLCAIDTFGEILNEYWEMEHMTLSFWAFVLRTHIKPMISAITIWKTQNPQFQLLSPTRTFALALVHRAQRFFLENENLIGHIWKPIYWVLIMFCFLS